MACGSMSSDRVRRSAVCLWRLFARLRLYPPSENVMRCCHFGALQAAVATSTRSSKPPCVTHSSRYMLATQKTTKVWVSAFTHVLLINGCRYFSLVSPDGALQARIYTTKVLLRLRRRPLARKRDCVQVLVFFERLRIVHGG